MKKDSTHVQALAIAFQESGSERVFAEIYKNVYPGLMYHIKRLSKDEYFAEDIVSKSFIDAHQKISQFNPEFMFTTWIYKIAQNNAIYQLRNKKKKKMYTFDSTFGGTDDGSMYESWLINNAAVPVSGDNGLDLDNLLNNNAVDDLFYKAMEHIGELDPFDNLILMESLSGIDHQTQADQHGMSYSTMRNAIFTARHAVQDKLVGTEEEKAWRYFQSATYEARTDFELAPKPKRA